MTGPDIAAAVVGSLLLAGSVVWFLLQRRRERSSDVTVYGHQTPVTGERLAIHAAIRRAYAEGRMPDNGVIVVHTSRHPSGNWFAQVTTPADIVSEAEAVVRGEVA